MFSPGKRGWKEKGWSGAAGREEMVWKLKARIDCPWQRTMLSHEQRSVHPAWTRDPITGCLQTPEPQTGSVAYHHLERLRCKSKCLSPVGHCLVYHGRKPFCLQLSVSCPQWHSLCCLSLLSFSPYFGWDLGPPRVIWVLPGLDPHLALAALEMLAFLLCGSDKTPSTQDLCMAAQTPRAPFLHPISMYVTLFRVWNKVPPLHCFKNSTCHKLLYIQLHIYSILSSNQKCVEHLLHARQHHTESSGEFAGDCRPSCVFLELSLHGGKHRQASIQSSSKEPTRKIFDCNHPWAE